MWPFGFWRRATSTGRAVSASATDGAGVGCNEAWAGSDRRQQDEGKREQAQGDELPTDEGTGTTAAQGGAPFVAESGSDRRRRRCAVRGRQPRGRVAGRTAAAGKTAATHPRSEASAGRAGPSRGGSRRQGQGRTRKGEA